MATRSKKILIGCGLGCLGIFALGIAGCVGFSVWIKQPVELVQPLALVGPETAGYVEWAMQLDDPGTAEFADRLIRWTQRDPEELGGSVPPFVAQILMSQQNKRNAKDVENLFPMVAAWTIQPTGVPGEDLHVATLGVEKLGNRMRLTDFMFRLFLRFGPSEMMEVYRGERIYVLPNEHDSVAIFLRGSHVFIATDLDGARAAVDQIVDQGTSQSRPATALEQALGALPTAPVRGVVLNRNGELERVWNALAELDPDASSETSIPWSEVESFSLSGFFVNASDFEGVLELDCVSAEWAAAHGERVIPLLRSEFRAAHVPLEMEQETVDDRVRVSFRLTDVFGFFDDLVMRIE